jgi:predicted transposase YdaD
MKHSNTRVYNEIRKKGEKEGKKWAKVRQEELRALKLPGKRASKKRF